ncbi:MAG: hypothetical protein V1762_00720 [Nitrospirota bacterium]
MRYPPNFKGFLKALFDTLRGKKLRPRIPKDESERNIDDYEIYEPEKDPGMEFWQKKAEEFAERKEQEKLAAEKRMIEDYESRHKDDKEAESANDEPKAIVESKSFVTRHENTTELPEKDAGDFHADVGIELDKEFDDDF